MTTSTLPPAVRTNVTSLPGFGRPGHPISVSWATIQPGGTGPANPAALDHYERLVDELLARGGTPHLTLHHRSPPRELVARGGWRARETAARFAEYASLVGARLGDRVPLWTTLREPWRAAFLGHGARVSAPARAELTFRAAHHLLLAHGLGTEALREVLPARARVSITLNLRAVLPGATSAAATAAVRRIDGLANRLFLDPLFRGHYPADVMRDTGLLTDWSFVSDDDLAAICTPLDLLGIHYDPPTLVDVGAPAPGPSAWPACPHIRFVEWPGLDLDDRGLRVVLQRVHDQYPPIPLLVTECGAAPGRAAARAATVREAVESGIDVRGYCAWTDRDDETDEASDLSELASNW
jgi:beta-glucosidase